MYVYVYMYMYTCIYIHVYVYMYMYMYTWADLYLAFITYQYISESFPFQYMEANLFLSIV